MEKRILLHITLGQLIQLHEMGFLSEKGKDHLIDILMNDDLKEIEHKLKEVKE